MEKKNTGTHHTTTGKRQQSLPTQSLLPFLSISVILLVVEQPSLLEITVIGVLSLELRTCLGSLVTAVE